MLIFVSSLILYKVNVILYIFNIHLIDSYLYHHSLKFAYVVKCLCPLISVANIFEMLTVLLDLCFCYPQFTFNTIVSFFLYVFAINISSFLVVYLDWLKFIFIIISHYF